MVTESPTEKNPAKRKRPARSEIARILYESASVQIQGMFGPKQGDGFRFWAQAVGPGGRYRAAQSPTFAAAKGESSPSSSSSSEAGAALDELIRRLWSDGWQPTSFGREWYQLIFRRPVLKQAQTPDS